ncbi:TPA: DNA topoisomerase (ATP-hydrolyzing) subunit B [Candidatus Dependentiae bacterium]|nr:DNA topoisomerase (ATP-hydrolyzing) subunit B [Candidatus Dependentiae bacterium]HCU00986.1 DNA topoisomerase (ATP-hydrolyzing) subunit B [Candidatus Dependentiae bacterium]
MADETKKSTYTAQSIKVMEGLEAVRKRPAMYIGSTSKDGLHHLVYEVVDNSVDEALGGHCDIINVTLHADGSCSVRDNGRGIPTDIHPTEKVSATEVVLTKLHAGGKFDKESYKYSGGLHGVGISVVNALSQWLELKIYQNGNVYEQRYERGKPIAPLKITGKTDARGTYIRFSPDPLIFPETEFNFDTLSARLRELAFLNKGLRITVNDENTNKHHEFFFEGGIVSFVEDVNKKKTPLFPEVIYFERSDEQYILEIALQYNDTFNEQLFSFVNNINTIDGGTHVAGFKSALTKACNKKAQQLKILKDNESLSSEDVREGLVAVINIKVPEPQFEGQTKGKLGNSEVKGIVDSWTFAFLNDYFEENPSIARKILQKAEVAKKAREAARKARDLTRRKTVLESTVLPGKLADCSNEDPSKTELFIVEGDSAGGSAKQARDRDTQAILPLRGKILNVEKAHLERVLSSEEIKALISAIGCGITDQCEPSKARYHKVILMTDADVDGAHIRTLLLTFFFRYMRQIVDKGYLYIAQPPLYKVKIGKKEQYLKDDTALKKFLLDWARENTEFYAHGKKIQSTEWQELLNTLNTYEINLNKISYDFKLSPEQCHALLSFIHAHPEVIKFGAESDFEKIASLLQSHFKDSQISYKATALLDNKPIEEPLTTHGFFVFKKRSHEWESPVEFFWNEKIEKLLEKFKDLIKLEQHESTIKIIDKERSLEAKGILSVIQAIAEISKPFMNIQRYKGLGEMNPDQLWETSMDPERRQFLQVSIDDELEADGWFATLMGDDVEGRRVFIERNGRFVKNLDV